MGLIRFEKSHSALFNSQRLLRAVITDVAGVESDRIDLTLNAVDLIGTPKRDALIRVAVPHTEIEIDYGDYLISRIQYSGPPAQIQVTATKAPFTLANKTEFDKRKTRSFEGLTLGELVTQIASPHGFSVRVDPDFSGEIIEYIDQTAESDHAFLKRLARARDALAKPILAKTPVYVFCRRGREKNFSGASLVPIKIAYDQRVYKYTYDEPGRSAYGGIEVVYLDAEAQKETILQVGQRPLKKFIHKFSSEQQARSFAEAQRKTLGRVKKMLSLSLALNPMILAETQVILGADWLSDLQGGWLVDRATHDFSARRTDLVLSKKS